MMVMLVVLRVVVLGMGARRLALPDGSAQWFLSSFDDASTLLWKICAGILSTALDETSKP